MDEQNTPLAPVERDEQNSAFTTPDRREYREIPSNLAFTEWDRVGQVRAILRELEQGQFQRASLLSTLQERDDRISGCWSIRIDTLLGTPLEFEPAQVDGQVTEETQGIADAAETDWPKMFQEGSLDRLFRQGKDLGYAFGELIVYEDEETGRWVPRLKVWHSQWAWWNWATDSYWITTSGAYVDGVPTLDGAGVIELPRIDRDIYSDGHWVVYAPQGWRYAFQTGAIRSTAMLHLKRQWDMRDWARYNEVYGLLIRKAVTPSGASDPDKARFASDIRNVGSEPTVECPTDATGNKFDIEITGAPTGTGGATFGESLHYVDECLGNKILGQSASGEKKSGLGDGDQNQNEAVRQDVLEKDARIADILKLQVLSWWTLWNFGDRRLCPTPKYMVQPEKSEEQAAAALLASAQAASAIKTAWPTADMDALAAEFGVTLMQPEEGVDPADDVNPDAALNGAQVASLLEIVASVARKELPRDAGIEMMQAAFPIDKAQAERIMGEVGNTFFIAPDEPLPTKETLTVRALSAGVGATKKKRAPTYTERLADEATKRGAAVMRPDIAEIKALVAESRTPEELRSRLLAHYKRMDPHQLADVVERAEIMATLGGRFEVFDNL